MKLFANENVFEPIIQFLRESGHDVLSIRDAGLSGISDEKVYNKACKEKLIIRTMDKDFTRLLRFPPEECGGIVVVKIYKRTIKETVGIFRKFFEKINEDDIRNNLVIITPEGMRIRRSKGQ